jgi:hypothetical protein
VKSSHRGLTTAQQLARLGLSRFFSRGSGLNASTEPAATATKSRHGPGRATEDGPVAELAWEIAETAQSCAYLAIELQVLASRSYGRVPTCPDLTYKQLSDLTRIFRALLTNMHEKLVLLNSEEASSAVCVINEDLAEAIVYTLAADKAITTVECMTRPASQGTPDTGTVGATR